MLIFSQNDEQTHILNFFGYFNNANLKDIVFLDCGMNDGRTLSNTHALALLGCKGLGIEASPNAYERAVDLYKDNDNVQIINAAITDKDGSIILHESGSHLSYDDVALLSTVVADEMRRWDKEIFTPIEVRSISFDTLLKESKYKTFDFISMDIEGVELLVLPQMDFKALGTKLACIEFNGKDKEKYDAIMLPFGFTLIHQNAENLLYAIE